MMSHDRNVMFDITRVIVEMIVVYIEMAGLMIIDVPIVKIEMASRSAEPEMPTTPSMIVMVTMIVMPSVIVLVTVIVMTVLPERRIAEPHQ